MSKPTKTPKSPGGAKPPAQKAPPRPRPTRPHSTSFPMEPFSFPIAPYADPHARIVRMLDRVPIVGFTGGR